MFTLFIYANYVLFFVFWFLNSNQFKSKVHTEQLVLVALYVCHPPPTPEVFLIAAVKA